MSTTPNLGAILAFLEDLSRHNHKTWFDQHRPAYEAARGAFEQFIDGLIDEFRASDNLQGLSAKDCLARIYRDVRFSKDKAPYKTNLGALLGPHGWKSATHGYYISIQPQARSMVAGGLYNPTPAQLDRFRQAIDTDATTFKKITQARAFVEAFGVIEGARLKTAPKGYARTHPDIALLQLKQITAVRRFSDQEVVARDFPKRVAATCRAMKPFLHYLNSLQP